MANAVKNTIGRFLIHQALCLQKVGERLALATPHSARLDVRVKSLQRFWFLLDSPLYIDNALVEGLFDAIFRPEYEASTRTSTSSTTRTTEDALELALAGEASVPAIFKVSATGKASGKTSVSDAQGETLVEFAIKSPERRLEALINLYAKSYPERILWGDSGLVLLSNLRAPDTTYSWERVEQLLDEPAIRPLIVLDLVRGTKLLPMFAELTTAEPLGLYKSFLQAVDPQGASVPRYPSDEAPQAEQRAYWSAFESVFDSGKAMGIVEAAAINSKGARIDWIDYRLVGRTSDDNVVPIHLHLTPRGRYATGTFAYQFIRRGFKFGLRIIGTLKKGYDINVLAVYER